MLAILFPHMFEDIEYLLPSGDVEMADEEGPSTRQAPRNVRDVTASAGPSRLRR